MPSYWLDGTDWYYQGLPSGFTDWIEMGISFKGSEKAATASWDIRMRLTDSAGKIIENNTMGIGRPQDGAWYDFTYVSMRCDLDRTGTFYTSNTFHLRNARVRNIPPGTYDLMLGTGYGDEHHYTLYITCPVHANVGGSWKPAKKVYVNVGGTWREAKTISTKVNGTWQTKQL